VKYASKTLHERCDRQLMVVLDTEFFGKSKKDDFGDIRSMIDKYRKERELQRERSQLLRQS
jgi:hypothetical protein